LANASRWSGEAASVMLGPEWQENSSHNGCVHGFLVVSRQNPWMSVSSGDQCASVARD
jgi:hypothetical protein